MLRQFSDPIDKFSFILYNNLVIGGEKMKKKLLKGLPDLLAIVLGNLFYSFVVAAFILPGKLISCGTTGLALIAQNLWGIPVSWFVLVFNSAMLALGWAVLGRKFAMTTVLSSFLYPVLLRLCQALLGDYRITDNMLLCAVFGGMGLGLALGVVIRAGASTGGMDIPPLILNKFFRVPVPVSLWVFDFTIMLLQLFFHTPEELLYGILMLIAINFTLNKTLVAGTGRTEIKIISDHAREICGSILKNADRGVTLLHGEGGYLHSPTQMVLSVVSGKELYKVQRLARAIDPECFMIVTQVTEVWGRGFSFGKEYREEAKPSEE